MKNIIVKIFSVILLSAFLLSTFQTVPVLASEGRTAKIYEYSNEVTLKRGKTTLNVYKGMRLKEGDTVKTGKDSNAYIELDGDKVVKLDALTVVTISNLSGDTDSGSTNISLSSGKIFNDIKKKLTQNSTYKVRTPNAVMGVRGTQFFVGYSRLGETNIAVLDGTVVATSYRSPNMPVEVNKNQTSDTGDLTQELRLKVKDIVVDELDSFVLETILENPELNNEFKKKLEDIDTSIEELLRKAKERERQAIRQEDQQTSPPAPPTNPEVSNPSGGNETDQESRNANLSSIVVVGGVLKPAFSSEILNYNVDITRIQTSLSLAIQKQDINSTIRVTFGQQEVIPSNGAYLIGPFDSTTAASIEVTAQNGNKLAYTLSIIKPDFDNGCANCSEPLIFNIGDGSIAHPFEVTTAEQLNHVREHLGASYIQKADITFNTTDDFSQASSGNFEPIGSSSKAGEYFNGSYNGNGYKISGLNIASKQNLVGLFGYNNGALSNIRLENIEVSGTIGVDTGTIAFIGGLVGYNYYAPITNCFVSGRVLANEDGESTVAYTINLGGIVGFQNNGQNISNCTNAAHVISEISSTNNNAINAGGIAGANGGGIIGCRNNGNVSINSQNASLNVGGIAGSNSFEGIPIGTIGNEGTLLQNGEISLCSNAGNINAQAQSSSVMLGGIAGNNSTTIQTSYNVGIIEGYKNNNYYGEYLYYDTYLAGIAGKNSGNEYTIIKNCYNAGQVTISNEGEMDSLAGIVGGGDSAIKYCYNVGELAYTNSDGFTSYGYNIAGKDYEYLYMLIMQCYGLVDDGSYGPNSTFSNQIMELSQEYNDSNQGLVWQSGGAEYIYPQLKNNLHQPLIEGVALTDLVITAETSRYSFETQMDITGSAIIIDNSNVASAIKFGSDTQRYVYKVEPSAIIKSVYVSAQAASECSTIISAYYNNVEISPDNTGIYSEVEGFYSPITLKIEVSKGGVTNIYTVLIFLEAY